MVEQEPDAVSRTAGAVRAADECEGELIRMNFLWAVLAKAGMALAEALVAGLVYEFCSAYARNRRTGAAAATA